jgi:hypothetical protein
MKSRRLIASPEAYEHWFKLARIADQCPLWVNSGHAALKLQCPLYPRKQTSVSATTMSALGQKRTHAPQQKDGYSITSSAIESKFSGTSMPSALAVVRLMTRSNLFDCSTGSSAGLAPLRMLPV